MFSDSGTWRRGLRLLAALAVLQTGSGLQAQEGGCGLSASDVYELVSPSVVEVFSIAINPFLVVDRVAPRSGTGFVIEDPSGEKYIITNFHLVADARELVVFQENGMVVFVEVVGVDPTFDMAVLRPQFFFGLGPPLQFAGEDELRIGQDAFTVGFPMGLGKTISAGIVSGVSRFIPRTTSSWLSRYIQTDSAVSPGNSGGPLVDDCGRVIGLVTASMSRYGAENIAFALPVEILKPTAETLIIDGHVSRPWHGLYGQMTDPPILIALGVPEVEWEAATGFLVETIEPGSAADRAGLMDGTWPIMWGGNEILLGGDIITHVNDQRINTLDAALEAVRSLVIGETVKLDVYRAGEVLTFSVMVEERPLLERELDIYREDFRRSPLE